MAVDTHFILLAFAMLLGPIAIAWLALGFFMLMSEPENHEKPSKQLDLFGGPDQ